MGLGWGLLWGTAKLSSSLAHKLNDNINDLKSKTSFSAKKSGYALFGDKIGYDSEGVRDYRALLLPKYVSNNDKQILAQGEYQLGKIKNPRTQEKIPFSIFGEHIFTHQLLIAPSGSGKTYGVIVPAVLSLLENHFRVVVNDVKGDMLKLIVEAKKKSNISQKFKVRSWNPFDSQSSHHWNPLDEVKDSRDTLLVQAIADSLLGSNDNQGIENKHFVERDKRWLQGLIMLVKKNAEPENCNLTYIYKLLTINQAILSDLIMAEEDLSIKGKLRDLLDIESTLYLSGLASKLSIFAERDTAIVTRDSDFSLDELLTTEGLLVLHSPISRGEVAWKLSALFYGMMKVKICSTGKTSVLISWMMDEAAFIAPKIALSESLAQLRSFGVSITIAIQSISQFGDDISFSKYSSNCSSKILLQHTDRVSATFLSKEIGTKTVKQVSKSIGMHSTHNINYQISEVPILSETDIMHFPSEFGFYTGIFYNPKILKEPLLIDFER
ncbi:type IV secretory system conjugative DNA transfer family protein [Streptococcus suis]|uniref:type IV secretory system conjugative DNA transfer family protein n=1 Tax=Streptococcus parasuis TaxID=1501662 RepID=UPI00040F8322|nr:type IV secretory system conjugative DNA transfer family protein [Streptococcus suis]NQK67329.1 type IV secretory system conjugative DNA transfer family protein [Streptococcus suis]WNF87501.1 type IV secretory system conjugative DNA transfer family protein [Streptococcus parasuis]